MHQVYPSDESYVAGPNGEIPFAWVWNEFTEAYDDAGVHEFIDALQWNEFPLLEVERERNGFSHDRENMNLSVGFTSDMCTDWDPWTNNLGLAMPRLTANSNFYIERGDFGPLSRLSKKTGMPWTNKRKRCNGSEEL